MGLLDFHCLSHFPCCWDKVPSGFKGTAVYFGSQPASMVGWLPDLRTWLRVVMEESCSRPGGLDAELEREMNFHVHSNLPLNKSAVMPR